VRLYFFFVAPALTPARAPTLNVFPSTWQSPVALLVVGIIDKERIGNSPLMKKAGASDEVLELGVDRLPGKPSGLHKILKEWEALGATITPVTSEPFTGGAILTKDQRGWTSSRSESLEEEELMTSW
jgi:hypothetical protein